MIDVDVRGETGTGRGAEKRNLGMRERGGRILILRVQVKRMVFVSPGMYGIKYK